MIVIFLSMGAYIVLFNDVFLLSSAKRCQLIKKDATLRDSSG